MRPEWTPWVAHGVIAAEKTGEQLIMWDKDGANGACYVRPVVETLPADREPFLVTLSGRLQWSTKISPDPIIPNPEMLYLSWWPGSTIAQPNMTHLPLIRDEGPFVAAWQSLKLLAWLVYSVVITRWLCGPWPTFRVRSAKTRGIIDNVQRSARRERVLEWIAICSCLIRLC